MEIDEMKTQVCHPNRVVATAQHYQRLVSAFTNWPLYLAVKRGWLRRSVVLMKTRSGLRIEVPWELRHAFKDIFLYHTYICPGILARLPERPTVIDVGGNVGFFALFALHLRPRARCFSFEPVAGNFALLQKNREANPQTDWRLFQAAVAGADGTVRICSPSGRSLATDAFIQRLRPTDTRASGPSEAVEARTLETLFAREGIRQCDWLKLDCEGTEYEILYQTPSALFDRVSVISLETHKVDGPGNNIHALADHLELLGYDIWLDGGVVYALKNT
jgi:FkbM family methyltransferase